MVGVVPGFAPTANTLISNFTSTNTNSFTAPCGARRRHVNRLRQSVRAAPRMCSRPDAERPVEKLGLEQTQPEENGRRSFVPGPGLLVRVALASLGVLIGGGANQILRARSPVLPPVAVAETQVLQSGPHEPVPMRALGIKTSDYLGERELRLRKTTQYSEAEEEIMELEEWEVSTKWFRDLQALWAGLASVGGIVVLYRGGVLWEKWIQEQERKDMEEEISMTGTYISPRAVRKDEDGDDEKNGKDKKDDDKPPVVGDSPPGGIDGLNRLLK